jgi:hypothetical protein
MSLGRETSVRLLRWVRLDGLICEYSQVTYGGRILGRSQAGR